MTYQNARCACIDSLFFLGCAASREVDVNDQSVIHMATISSGSVTRSIHAPMRKVGGP